MLVKIRQGWCLTIPKKLRDGFDDRSVVEGVRRDDGVIELRPQGVSDPSQAWFWTERWQRMEREADEDYFVTIDGELAIRWRRVGGHAIFEEP